MKNKKKILKTILEISILILSAFGTFFLGYHYGTKTFGPIARYNYHLDNDGNIQSDNNFNNANYTYKHELININENLIQWDVADNGGRYFALRLYDSNLNYVSDIITFGDDADANIRFDYLTQYYKYYIIFSIIQDNFYNVIYPINDVFIFDEYNYISFKIRFNNSNVDVIDFVSSIHDYKDYEPFGTWYTPQTFAREQWDRNYSTLKQSKFDIVGYKEDGSYTSKPYYTELNIYEPFKREDSNKYYVSLEKVGFEDWDNSKTYEITQSFNNYVPIISPGYYIINRTLVDNFKQIQFSVKTGLQHEKYTSFNIVFGSNRTDAYYDFNNSWIYYYIPNSVINNIRRGNNYYYEVPQFIIDSLQSRQVWDIKYSSLPNNSTSNFEEIEFYIDTSIFGYEIIYDDAYNSGYDVGYNNGRNDALNIDWLKRAISTIDDILNIQLLGPLTLGNIIAIPLIIGIVSFVIGWFK